MHQKLQFVVTVVNEPDLVILDEPFSGLDPVNQDLLKDIILQMRDEGKTIVFSTHVMHEAERLCDFILLINKAKPLLDGRLDEIQSRHRSHAVSVALEGDTSFIKTLPMVKSVETQGRRMVINTVKTKTFLLGVLMTPAIIGIIVLVNSRLQLRSFAPAF